ncbi:type VI secretion system protein TssA [Pseudoalteromonas ruthenica]|uniref:type VI secretion system protein TssA n=1 Tax=Pseudoalteromonas ruthenica TaxID=151081 RepID=UPI0011093288|nr:type VI secretion system protein TssA [Pseudoalteromonas ruthenica]TLX50023.1 type VI secretion system protein TssA [Pseudoalteromonas ruthenica]
MSGTDLFDLSPLVNAISDEQPTGVDPREDVSPTSTYYTLKDLRNTLRADERNALIDDESIIAVARDWRPLLEQIPDVLSQQCKDLELVAWYIEGLCRLHGFAGLSHGFELAAQLIELYWDTLYPTPDEDDIEERVAPIVGLNGIDSEGALIIPLKSIAMTEGVSQGPFSLWEYERAVDLERLDEEKRERRVEEGAVSLEQITTAVKETPTEYFVALDKEIDDCLQAFTHLSEAMDEKVGSPQPTSYITKTLEQCRAAIKHLAGDRIEAANAVDEPAADDEQASDGGAADSEEQSTSGGSKDVIQASINSRQDAIKQLQKISDFFRKTEPHSPMSYTIEQVIRWSELTLPELLNELISDNDARTGYFKLSGIKVEDSET